MTIVAETERLILRHVVPADAVPMRGVFCDPEVMRYSKGVKTSEWVDNWVGEVAANHYPVWGFGLWAVTLKPTGEVAGYCGLFRYAGCGDDEAELGYRLAIPYWGQGLAPEAAAAACAVGLNDHGLARIVALVDPDNAGSVRVLEKIGMEHDGAVMKAEYHHPDLRYVMRREGPRDGV